MEAWPRRHGGNRAPFQCQEIATPRRPVTRGVTFRPNTCETKRGERGVVERYRAVKIGDAEGKMTKHRSSLNETNTLVHADAARRTAFQNGACASDPWAGFDRWRIRR